MSATIAVIVEGLIIVGGISSGAISVVVVMVVVMMMMGVDVQHRDRLVPVPAISFATAQFLA